MSAKICWLCDDELACASYSGTKLLGDEGEKPCSKCLEEALNDDEAQQDCND